MHHLFGVRGAARFGVVSVSDIKEHKTGWRSLRHPAIQMDHSGFLKRARIAVRRL
jgi:hypothetical protein